MPTAFTADFGRTSEDYGRWRAGFPPSFFDRVAAWGIGRPGQRILDLGAGTGTLARGFAERGANAIGLDIAEAQLAKAAELDRAKGVAVAYRLGRAEATGLPEASVDVVIAGQCWHWFENDLAMAEARRVLVPEGRLVICNFDWLPFPGSVVEATEGLILHHNPRWPYAGGSGIHPRRLDQLGRAGFRAIESFTYDVDQLYSHEGWRGRIRASAGIGGSLAPDAVATFDADHSAMLADRFPDDPLLVPHRVFAATGRRPG